MDIPAHFVLLSWQGDKIAGIRDFLFAPYVMESLDWICMPAPIS
jgi:RNA polymerase sigma-70 factor (ECF subfamily)